MSLIVYGALVAVGKASGVGEFTGDDVADTATNVSTDRRPAIAAAVLIGIVVYYGVTRPDNRVTVLFTGDQAAQSRKKTEIMPQRWQTWDERGNVLFQAGRHDEAIAAMEAALRYNPAYLFAHQIMAKSLRAQGKLAEAVAQFQIAIRLDPTNGGYHADLGAVYMDLGNYAEAERELVEALQRNPALGEAIKNLRLLRGRSGVR